MAINVMILGSSGTGKSASMRNFKDGEVALINVCGKPLPFRGKKFDVLNSDDYGEIKSFLKFNDKKVIVIDDAQYLMANEYMRRAQERGFDKFTEIGQHFWNFINFCESLPSSKVVYFLQHTELANDDKTVKAKTIGKLLDEKITLEGMFAIVLRTSVDDGVYTFHTRTDGADTVKSPIGMFDSATIDNDLAKVDHIIRDYYSMVYEEEGGFADAAELIKDEPKKAKPRAVSDEERISKDIDASEPVGGTQVDTPLTKWGELNFRLEDNGMTKEQLKEFVVGTGVLGEDIDPIDYDDDFIDYLMANFDKIKEKVKGGK